MIHIYENLCQLTADNLSKDHSLKKIHFESSIGLNYSIFDYPEKILLEIEGTEAFIYECFYKILDRNVDENNLKRYKKLINSGLLTKEQLIKEIFQSNERKIKMTGLTSE